LQTKLLPMLLRWTNGIMKRHPALSLLHCAKPLSKCASPPIE
jgi:hypothetical protein